MRAEEILGKEKCVFLTGSTGFVGRCLLPALTANGYTVQALARVIPAHTETMSSIHWVRGDLHIPETWESALQKCNAIIHLASVHEGTKTRIRKTNVAGTAQLVDRAKRFDITRFVYLSSVTAANNPQLPYSQSIWEAEQLISQELFSSIILRTTVIVGPGDPFLAGLVQIVKRWPIIPIFGDGSVRFQPIWIGDMVEAVLSSLLPSSTETEKKIISVGGDTILSIDDIISKIQERLHLRKRKIFVPRKPAKSLADLLHRMNLPTPFTSAFFLTKGLVTPVNQFKTQFSHVSHSFEQILTMLLSPEEPDLT